MDKFELEAVKAIIQKHIAAGRITVRRPLTELQVNNLISTRRKNYKEGQTNEHSPTVAGSRLFTR